MLTRNDLKTVHTNMGADLSTRHDVEVSDGRKFSIFASSVTEEDFDKLPIDVIFFYAMYPQYMIDVAVFPVDEDWNVLGTCGPECEDGMCTRRIAEDHSNGTVDRGYELLLGYLNS